MKKSKRGKWQPADLLDNTAYLVLDVGRLLRRRFDHRMDDFGLPRPEWFLLAHLCFFDGCSQQELADTMDVTKGGMAKLIARMEEKDLLRRENVVENGRIAKRVYLTEQGWSLALKVDAESVSTVTEAGRALPKAQLAQLHELLRTLRLSLIESVAAQDR